MDLDIAKMRHGIAERWRRDGVLVSALILAIVFAFVGIFISALRTDLGDKFWLEVAKAGVQVLGVAVIGGAVTAAWKYLEQQRDRDRQLHEQQLAVFHQIVESYNEVKAIRRRLRSLGFRASTGQLNEIQVSGFRDLMLRLNVVQLKFEALKREVGETDFFKEDTSDIIASLSIIEDYINGVLAVWEDRGSLIEVGANVGLIEPGLQDLVGYDVAPFNKGIRDPRRTITRLIHEHLFGPASEETKRKLDELDKGEEEKPRDKLGEQDDGESGH